MAEDKHECDLPRSGWPGDEWTCPSCGRQWWADDTEDEDGAPGIYWVKEGTDG